MTSPEWLSQQLTAHEVDELLASTTAGDASVRADDKRVRRTEIERLSRRRRQASLQAQRAQLQQLQAQFATLLADCARQQRSDDKRRTRESSRAAEPEEDQAVAFRERFIAVLLEIERLNAVQKRLRQELRGKHVVAFSIQSITAARVDEWQDAVPRPLTNLVYTPLRVDAYFGLLRDAYAEVLAFEALLQRDREGTACMGWRHRQQSHPRFALSSLTKTFRGRRDSESLMRDTWALLSSEQRLKQVFDDWSDGIRCRVLYDLMEDAAVLYRTFERRHVAKRFHSIVLLYRVQTDDGFAIGTRTIPSPAVQDSLQLPDKWVTICEWIRFRFVPASGSPSRNRSEHGAAACESEPAVVVEFGVGHPTPLPAPRWRLTTNFFTTVLRWEGALATPMALTWS